MGSLTGRSVVITGGAGEIARETARRFLDAGARVLLVDLHDEALQQAVAELDSEHASYCTADVTSEEDTRGYVQAALERNGTIDVLLANAGIEGPVAPVADFDAAAFDRVMAVNVRGVFLGIKHVFPIMAAGGGGSVVITSSVAGVSGSAGVCAYNASKHAVVGLMRSTAKEGGPLNIRVNTVNPAPIEGRMMRSLEQGLNPDDPGEVRESLLAAIPLARYGTPADVAGLMLFLASDDASYLTGGIYMVDGGMIG